MIPRENDPARFTSSGLMGVEVFLPFSPRNVCIPWGFQANTNLLSNFPLLPMNETYGWKGAIILWDMAKPQNAPILFKLEHFFLFAFHTLNLLSHFSENSITKTKSSYRIFKVKISFTAMEDMYTYVLCLKFSNCFHLFTFAKSQFQKRRVFTKISLPSLSKNQTALSIILWDQTMSKLLWWPQPQSENRLIPFSFLLGKAICLLIRTLSLVPLSHISRPLHDINGLLSVWLLIFFTRSFSPLKSH